jgi:para-nitrobenzyl esterase
MNQGAVPIERVVEPRVLPEDPFAVLQRDGSPVPLLTGSTREETTGLGDDPTQPLDAAQYAARIHAEFDSYGPHVADHVLSHYPVSDYDAPIWALVAVDSDFGVTCEVRNAARAALGPPRHREAHNPVHEVPVWRYLFTHRVENDPSLNVLRAFHVEETYFLFGHLEQLGSPYTPSADEIQLSKLLIRYWTRFAATGDPNGPGDFRWPRYSDRDDILQLDVTPTRFRGYHNPQCDFLTPIINRIPP